ncbi:putative reverse transcriptase domain, reverse transcriptase zinc-binding domain protein [Tanacetum coccineum]
MLISSNQSAFVPGRRISDNILLTQELMHNYHLDRGTPRCAFKVDIQKAYDIVDWCFLKEVLLAFGFHVRMVNWIMKCVTATSYSLCINGVLHGYFKGKRVQDSESFTYHRHCSKLELVNLCFADDLFLFAHRDPNSARVIMEALDEFQNASGLTPSLPKSMAYFCNVLNHVKELTDRIRSRIKDWKNKSLSAAGRLQLVRSVIGSMHVYWALVFILPTRILLELKQLMRGFLWCQGDMRKCKVKVSWEVVCLPKNEGGLGLRRLELFNKALMVAVANGAWIWPSDWYSKYHILNSLAAPNLSDVDDRLEWRDHMGVVKPFLVAAVCDSLKELAGLLNVADLITVIVDLIIPFAKQRSVQSVIAKLVVAACSYFNSRKDGASLSSDNEDEEEVPEGEAIYFPFSLLGSLTCLRGSMTRSWNCEPSN